MPIRKEKLSAGRVFHVYTRSIARFHVFRSDKDYKRMQEAVYFYRVDKPVCKYASFVDLSPAAKEVKIAEIERSVKPVKIFAYCLMPTHLHLMLEADSGDFISRYLNVILKSYSHYFNTKYNRRGPLWEGPFKTVAVEKDEQFLHLTRYIHLNPVSAFIVDNPRQWDYSSYGEYLGDVREQKICDNENYCDMRRDAYEKFVCDNIGYQRKLEKIKHLTLE